MFECNVPCLVACSVWSITSVFCDSVYSDLNIGYLFTRKLKSEECDPDEWDLLTRTCPGNWDPIYRTWQVGLISIFEEMKEKLKLWAKKATVQKLKGWNVGPGPYSGQKINRKNMEICRIIGLGPCTAPNWTGLILIYDHFVWSQFCHVSSATLDLMWSSQIASDQKVWS